MFRHRLSSVLAVLLALGAGALAPLASCPQARASETEAQKDKGKDQGKDQEKKKKKKYASYRSKNFDVKAPTVEIARRVARAAERERKRLARLWLGREIPDWPQPCPLRVKISLSGATGATVLTFESGQVLDRSMRVAGTLPQILASVVPHEVSHTIFAHFLRRPVPRWADEGAATLSEDRGTRRLYEMRLGQLLDEGRAMPLRRLFALKEYPKDIAVLYVQGYSVTRFLVVHKGGGGRAGRRKFLAFIRDGAEGGWDKALKKHYRYRNMKQLEEAWHSHLQRSGLKGRAIARP